MASSTLAIPGPWSAKTSRSPERGGSCSTWSSISPPRPCSSALRASSLAAVTSFVWSTSEKRSSWARRRTSCRTSTTSASEPIATVSSFRTGMQSSSRAAPPSRARPEERHPLLHVEGGPDAVQGEAELDEGDRHRRLHADDDGLRVHEPGHRGDRAEHPADEGVDDVERRDVDEHAARARSRDLGGEIVLQRQGELVVHVH